MSPVNNRTAKTATKALCILWEEGFFRLGKSLPKIIEHLALRHNNFTTSEMGMALKRAKFLIRRGSRGQYEYIQKYPFSLEEVDVSKHRTGRKGSQEKV
jgi:hypothetical protein